MSTPQLRSAALTDPGLRPVNEDTVVCQRLPDGRWFAAVADGMGGLQAGEVASRTAVDVLLQALTEGQALVPAVEVAHRAVLEEANGRPMGTTLVAALVDRKGLSIANVGDSRAYLYGPAGLVQVTRDHTAGAEAMVRNEPGSRGEIGDSRWARALTRSLGSSEPLQVDRFGPFRLEEGVRILLCSDGVHGTLPNEVIEAILVEPTDADVTVGRLVRASLDQGSRDNVSAVLLHVRGPGDQAPEEESGTDGADVPVALPGATGGATPERRAPEPLLPLGRDAESATTEEWDLAALVTRSHNPMRRKPGRLNAAMLVVGLFLAIATLILLLRTMTG